MKALALNKEIEVELSSFIRPSVSDYTVYDGKIWRCVCSSGMGIYYTLTLERTGDEMVIRGNTEEMKSLRKLIKPTGHITI